MTKDEKLIEEDLEITAITAGAAPVQLPGRVISVFPALAHRNFQFYFAGQAISLIGFWLQQVGLGWYIFNITHSAFWVGISVSAGGLPFLIFTTFAGVFVDKVDKQKLLIITQILEGLIALLLGFLIITQKANLPQVLILAFVNGIVSSIDLPARLTFIVEMVGKRDLASAIPINNGVFNAARFVGPALAGWLIASFGVGWTFILNGLSYLPGILAIYAIKPIYKNKQQDNARPLESLKEGLKFSFTHPKILYFIILGAMNAIFIWPYATLMPVVAEKVFASGAQGLGSLLSAAGAGSLAGAVITSAFSKLKNRGDLVLAGILISSMSLFLFSINRSFLFAHLFLFTAGFGILIQVSTLNTLVQLASPDAMRGRVMAVYLTMFIGIMPIGSALSGIIAQYTSAPLAIGLGSAAFFIGGLYFYSKKIFFNFSG